MNAKALWRIVSSNARIAVKMGKPVRIYPYVDPDTTPNPEWQAYLNSMARFAVEFYGGNYLTW